MFFKATYILVLLCADFKLCIGIQQIETRKAMDAWFTALNDKKTLRTIPRADFSSA